MPSFAEAWIAVSGSRPRSSSICTMTLSTSADGRSILLMTGMIVQIVLHGKIEIRQGLGFDALAGIDEQQSALTGFQRPGDFIGEIYMTGRVDEVEMIGHAIPGRVRQAYGLAFDGNSPLSFDIHGIQDLILEVPVRNHIRKLNESVGQRGFAMVDMGDDAEISNIFHI